MTYLVLLQTAIGLIGIIGWWLEHRKVTALQEQQNIDFAFHNYSTIDDNNPDSYN